MRDKRRIKRIITTLEYIWKQNPDLRFMQLLGNCFRGDNYRLEDEQFEKIIKQFYSE